MADKVIASDPNPEGDSIQKMDSTQSSVVQFFEGRNVFITGATGFMGKVLVYKLLKTCPKIGAIYLLIRPKREFEVDERLKQLLQNEIFEELPEDQLNKVVAIAGDITLPRLGISEQDTTLLEDTVSVIFHCAATVKFDEELTKSIQMNIEGTQSVVNLARTCRWLKVLVHLSTAFSHCYQNHMEEKFYRVPKIAPKALLSIYDTEEFPQIWNDVHVTKKLMGNHPNTYTFTKALAEDLLFDTAADLPLVIVRPSIVVASKTEPFPGWVDNLNGPTGMTTGAATGILRSILAQENFVADVVPVDMAINLMCLAAAKRGSLLSNLSNLDNIESLPSNDESSDSNDDSLNGENQSHIYNFSSGTVNPITWKEIRDKARPAVIEKPFQSTIWYPNLTYQNKRWVDVLSRTLQHTIPGFVADVLCLIVGSKPFLGKIVSKMHKAMGALEYFANRQWTWDSKNVQKLSQSLQEVDKELFPVDLSTINWDNFMYNYVLGTRRFLLKDDPNKCARTRFNVLYGVHLALVALLAFCLIYVLGLLPPLDFLASFPVALSLALVLMVWHAMCL